MILPFSVQSENRTEPFLEEMEKAAVFCLAELERRKGGGIVLKQPTENLAFIARLCYPFWLVPFHESSLVFDGLGIASHTFSYTRIQDAQAFIHGIDRSTRSREVFTAFLTDNINYFQTTEEEEKRILRGLIANPQLIQSFTTYFSEAEPLESTPSDVVLVTSRINETDISPVTQELVDLRKRLEEEVKGLNRSMKLLNLTVKDFSQAINGEIKETRDKFNAELEKRRGPVEEKVKEIRRQHDTQVTTTSQKFEKEILRLQKEKVKQEKMKERVLGKIARCEVEIKTRAAKKDTVGEQKWKDERKRFKKELSHIKSDIEKFEKEIKAFEDEKSSEIFRIRSERDAKIQEANKVLLEIESARDAKIQILQQEIKKMEESASTIIKQINNAAKLRELSIKELDKLGIQQKKKGTSIVYMPFYLICFQYGSNKRYMCIPPSIVNSIRLMVKIKGALGKAKIKQMLTSRLTAITSVLDSFVALMEDNAVFEREIVEAGAKVNIFRTNISRESIKSGLDKLKVEGWLSEKEHQSFSERLK